MSGCSQHKRIRWRKRTVLKQGKRSRKKTPMEGDTCNTFLSGCCWIYFSALLKIRSSHSQSCPAYEKESWRQEGPLAGVTFIWKPGPITTPVDISTADRFTLVSTLIGAEKSYSLNKLNLWRGSSVFHVPSSSKKKNHDPITTPWEIADDNGISQSSLLLL